MQFNTWKHRSKIVTVLLFLKTFYNSYILWVINCTRDNFSSAYFYILWRAKKELLCSFHFDGFVSFLESHFDTVMIFKSTSIWATIKAFIFFVLVSVQFIRQIEKEREYGARILLCIGSNIIRIVKNNHQNHCVQKRDKILNSFK